MARVVTQGIQWPHVPRDREEAGSFPYSDLSCASAPLSWSYTGSGQDSPSLGYPHTQGYPLQVSLTTQNVAALSFKQKALEQEDSLGRSLQSVVSVLGGAGRN